jgi:hypothetical protein
VISRQPAYGIFILTHARLSTTAGAWPSGLSTADRKMPEMADLSWRAFSGNEADRHANVNAFPGKRFEGAQYFVTMKQICKNLGHRITLQS